MQILVLGMHRSGTSAVTRLLNMMGAYVGTEDSLLEAHTENLDGLWEQNRKGFWERKDVVDLNEEVLTSLGLAWNRPAAFNPNTLKSPDLDWARKRIHKILAALEPSRPWALKDPRLCLTLPLWLEQLEVPVVVMVWRDPVEVAASLKTRNDFPTAFSRAMWESYYAHAISAAVEIPRTVVSFEELIRDPLGVSQRLYDRLCELGFRGLTFPPEHEITAFIDPTLHHERATKKNSVGQRIETTARILKFFESDTSETVRSIRVAEETTEALRQYEQQMDMEAKLREKNAELRETVQILKMARRDMAQSVDLFNKIENLFDQANRNWWWRLGLKLRRIVPARSILPSSPKEATGVPVFASMAQRYESPVAMNRRSSVPSDQYATPRCCPLPRRPRS